MNIEQIFLILTLSLVIVLLFNVFAFCLIDTKIQRAYMFNYKMGMVKYWLKWLKPISNVGPNEKLILTKFEQVIVLSKNKFDVNKFIKTIPLDGTVDVSKYILDKLNHHKV